MLLSPHSILDNLSVNSFQRTENKKASKKERMKGEISVRNLRKIPAPDEI